MITHALVVHPNSDMILEITRLLVKEARKAKGHDVSVTWAKTQMAAEQEAREEKPVDLVVTALEIPEDDKPSAGAGEQRRQGLELVRRLRAVSPGMSAILITSQVDNDVFAFAQSARVGLVMEGRDFWDQLIAKVNEYLGSSKPEVPSRVDLEIALSTKKGCYYQFQVEGQPAGEPNVLVVDPSRLKRWVNQSRAVQSGAVKARNHTTDTEQWEEQLSWLSDALAEELFESTPTNRKFLAELNRWVGKVGIRNIRVRFAVEDQLHPIVVEALKQRTDDDYWMLQTAVYRRQEHHGESRGLEPRGLFQDELTRTQPINFLIIQADVLHEVIVRREDWDLKLLPLPNLNEEVTAVERLLSDLKKKGTANIGEVRVINTEAVPAGGSFKQLVEDVLKVGPWHVLHYAGHTYFDVQHQAGYLFFPDGDDGLEPVRVDTFAWFLTKEADTRLVFLSSCEGAQQDFIYHLAKERVPAIMGFLWSIEDAKAAAYAKSFYEHLLAGNERSVEYACLEARKYMHAQWVDSPIWASAVLVIQVGV